MCRQGYLILHEKRHAPKVCYFALEDGSLRYYSASLAEHGHVLGEVRLSGCKIAVKAQKRHDGVPNSFYLELRKVFVKDRSYTLGSPVRVELSAHTNEERQEWGKALFSWQRYYWREPSVAKTEEECAADQVVKAQLDAVLHSCKQAKEQPSNQSSHHASTLVATGALAVAKQPLSFLRRNATSLRRSLSTYMPSTTSSMSTVSSSESTSSTRNNKADAANAAGPEETDCVKDKVALASVTCQPERSIYLGDNQNELHAY